MIERIYLLLKILKEQDEVISAQRILELLEDEDIYIDIKTIYSDVKKINDFHLLMFGKQLIMTIRRKGYLIENDIFDDAQIRFLLDSINFSNSINQEETDELVSVIKKLSSKPQINRLGYENTLIDKQNHSLLLTLNTINKAINLQQNIRFNYIDYIEKNNKFIEVNRTTGNDGELYQASPYKIVLHKSKYYLLAYNAKRPNVTSIYRIDRMRKVIISSRSTYVDIRDEVDIEKDFQNNTNMYMSTETKKLVMLVNKRVVNEVVNQFGDQPIVHKQFDGNYEVTIEEVAINEGLIGWILMLNTNIKVIEPLDLKDKIKNKIHELNNYYS